MVNHICISPELRAWIPSRFHPITHCYWQGDRSHAIKSTTKGSSGNLNREGLYITTYVFFDRASKGLHNIIREPMHLLLPTPLRFLTDDFITLYL